MQAALLRDLIVDDNINAEALRNGFRYIHRQLQLDFSWRAMEARVEGLPYLITDRAGVIVESAEDAGDCKSIRDVFIETVVSGNITNLENVWPANQGKAVRDIRIAQLAQGSAPTVANGWNQKWFEAAQRLRLLITPSANLTLSVDFYRFLPFYPSDEDPAIVDSTKSDWFSQNIPDAMQYGAGYHILKGLKQDNLAETYKANFVDLVKMAWDADLRAKQGALAESYSPMQPAQAKQ
jgi:hypothetical protein